MNMIAKIFPYSRMVLKNQHLLVFLIVLLMCSCQEHREIKRDFVKFDMVESYQDSVLMDTRGKRPMYMVRDSLTMSRELFAALKTAQKGKWTFFELPADSVFSSGRPRPAGFAGKVQVRIRLLGLLSTESEMKADMEKYKGL